MSKRYFLSALVFLCLFSGILNNVFSATYSVNNLNDSGIASFRQALLDSNSNVGPDTIIFTIGGIIQPLTTLPAISDTSGATIVLGRETMDVILDGTIISDTCSGLIINSNGNTVYKLIITNFPIAGVELNGADAYDNSIHKCFIGTEGTTSLGNKYGIYFSTGSNANTVTSNIICGNEVGILIEGSGTNHNIIDYCNIGINNSNNTIPNSIDGIQIFGGAKYNEIVNCTISGNGNHGIYMSGTNTRENRINSNKIGTNLDGTAPMGNLKNGINIDQGSSHAVIGGLLMTNANVISGNYYGINIQDIGSDSNSIMGNFIGTDINGGYAIPNTYYGIHIWESTDNFIGSYSSEYRNIISGNSMDGIRIVGSNSDSNIVIWNYIGTDVSGSIDVGNERIGVYISNGASNNFIGVPGSGNVISGNDQWGGIVLDHTGTTGNWIRSNFIGTDCTGMFDLGNSRHGIYIYNGTQSNTVGGTAADEKNIISGNGNSGIFISGIGTERNTVIHNYIGVNVNCTNVIPNGLNGITLNSRTKFNIIGGSIENNEFNIISGNTENGIQIRVGETQFNEVKGNFIGTNVNGTAIFPNELNGILISEGAQSNTIGGTISGEENVIAFNTLDGIRITDDGTIYNRLTRNSIYSNSGLGINLGTDSVTPNDNNDSDTGPNELLNFPILELLTDGSGNYILNGTAGANNEIEVYIVNNSTNSVDPDPTGYGEGYEYLISLQADGSGEFSTTSIPNNPGLGFTAIAIDQNNNTSEFGYDVFISSATVYSGVIVSPEDMTKEFIRQGSDNILMVSMDIYTNTSAATLTQITYSITGSCVDSDILNSHIYLDNGDGSFSESKDTLIGSGTVTGKQVTVDITDQTINTSAKTLFITLDIADSVKDKVTFGVRFNNSDCFTVTSPDEVSSANLPFETGVSIIKTFADSLDNVFVYPNPWTPKIVDKEVVFTNLTEDVTIKIYTISGELIFETDADGNFEWSWFLTNNGGEEIASGIYIYYIKNGAGQIKKGKIAVIK